MIKIQPKAEGLCVRCRHGFVAKPRDREEITMCAVLSYAPMHVRFPIERCKDFEDDSTPSKWDMEKIAWTISLDRSGKVTGFAPPKKEDN